jgi:hypothetical protein
MANIPRKETAESPLLRVIKIKNTWFWSSDNEGVFLAKVSESVIGFAPE